MRPPSLVKPLYVKFGHIGSRVVHGVQTDRLVHELRSLAMATQLRYQRLALPSSKPNTPLSIHTDRIAPWGLMSCRQADKSDDMVCAVSYM